MLHRDDPAYTRYGRRQLPGDVYGRRRRSLTDWPGGGRFYGIAEPDPDVRPQCAGTFAEHPGHPWEDILTRIDVSDALGKLRQDFIWRGTLAVHQPVRHSLDAFTYRLEGDRNEGGRQDRKPETRFAALSHEVTDAHHDRNVDQGDKGGHRTEEERLVDDKIDVVKAVFQHREADRQGDGEHGCD